MPGAESASLAPAQGVAGAAAATACAHCGLPVPAGLAGLSGKEPAFCCGGCRTAWDVLHDAGLARYYDLSERRAARVESSGRTFEEFDHPAFHELWVRGRAGGLCETDLYLEGVHCASCVWLVERTPLAVPGVARAELDMARGIVRLAWNPAATRLSTAARFLDTLGYRPHPFRGARADALRRDEDRGALIRIGVAGAIATNVMLASVALYSGRFSGMEAEFERYFRWIAMLLTAPALAWPGRVFFRGAWSSLRARALHMDVPVAIALAGAYARGVANTFSGRGPVYFDGVAALVFLLLVGRFLQTRAQRAAADSGEMLYALSPPTARLVEDDGSREVPAESLVPGMVIEARHGETLPGDGVVVAGEARLDRSLLTGESRPADARPGDTVYAGTVVHGATLRVRVEKAGEETRVALLLREVERSAARRAPIVRSADRLAGVFVAVVLVLAGLTWGGWSRVDPAKAFDHAVALLVVTCPCALALATPLAITVAIGRAARAGILVRGGDALEALAKPATLVLDKTGTLTEGRTSLADWEGDDAVRPAVLALERHSAHPIAAGFVAAWPGVPAAVATGVTSTTGGGLEGEVEGRRFAIGSPAFVLARAADPAGLAARGAGEAHTPVLVAADGRVLARAGFGDAVRPDAAATLAALRARGWRTRLLSGDAPPVVLAVGARLGFAPEECAGGASPEAKLAAIEALARGGRVVMVGDGVNDAAAIARATVGVGVKGGAEACLAAADVFLARPGIAPLAELVEGSARTLGVIRRGIAISIAYNVTGAALAIGGFIDPLVAALLMPASSLTVVLVAWRGHTFGSMHRGQGGA